MKPLSPIGQSEAAERISRSFKMLADEFAGQPLSMSIKTETAGAAFALVVTPHPSDVAKFVGADGVMDKAMRLLIAILARREGFARSTYVVRDGEQRWSGKRVDLPDQPDWNRERIAGLFEQTCCRLFAETHAWHWNDKDWKSTLELMISASEARWFTDAELCEALSRVFGAIGRANGRKIFVNLTRRGGA